MTESQAEQNKALVLGAFEALRAEDYMQHSSLIVPGREVLFALVRTGPPTMHYENNLIMCDGDTLILRGRFSGTQEPDHIEVDVVRLEAGQLKEHWDFCQPEATKSKSLTGLPMLADRLRDE